MDRKRVRSGGKKGQNANKEQARCQNKVIKRNGHDYKGGSMERAGSGSIQKWGVGQEIRTSEEPGKKMKQITELHSRIINK